MKRNLSNHWQCQGHRQGRGGHILFMTLMLLAITVLILTGIARHSLQLAYTASQSRIKLQEKWAVASCQRFALQNSQRLLSVDGQDSSERQARVAGIVMLSDIELALELADESSKLDLNTVSEFLSRQEIEQTIRQLTDHRELKIRLRPLQPGTEALRIDPYECWGQVFVAGSAPCAASLQQATSKLTCWGRKINYQTADPEVLRLGVKAAAGSIIANRLVSELERDKRQSLDQLLSKINPTEKQTQAIRKILSSTSRAGSVWVTASSHGKSRSYFVVQEKFSDNVVRFQTFDLR